MRIPKPVTIGHFAGKDADDRWFNAGLIKWRDGYLMAVRHAWNGCELFIADMDAELKMRRIKHLPFRHPACMHAKEDPRLFMHKGKVHVSFSGVESKCYDQVEQVTMLYASLSDDMNIEQVFCPQDPSFQHWEKNHVLFDHDGELWGIYSANPYRAFQLRGNLVCRWAETPGVIDWLPGGPMRGSAPPIRMGGEYWHFFHGVYHPYKHKKRYVTGLYTFEAKYPFRPVRMIPRPIMEGDPKTNIPGSLLPDVVFTCGAVVDGERVILSSGEHDYRVRFDAFKVAELEACLRPVAFRCAA